MANQELSARLSELEVQISDLARDPDGGEGPMLKALLDDMAKRHAVEEQLRQAQEWLHLAQEAGRVCAYTFDFASGRLDWSPSTMALYGFAPSDEPTLERWLSAIHQDDRAAVQAVAEDAIRQGRDVDHRFRVARPDGSIVWVADRGRILLGPDGSSERLVGINVDVTELVELGRRTAESEERLRLAMQAVHIACWDWDLVAGSVTWDENLSRLGGLDDDFGGTFEAFWTLVHEDDRPRVRQALDDALAGVRDYEVEFRMHRSDGSIRWTHTRATVVRDATGTAVRLVGVDADITERKNREAALRENDRFLQSVLDASTDCIKVIELDGSLSYMNRNGQFIMEVGDITRLLGQPWDSLWPEPGASHVREALANARQGRPSTFEAFCPTGAGTPKWWDVSVSAILDDQGAPSRIVSISRDITARHAADDQLKLFNAELHHRIKNNLATVQAMARATLRNAPDAATFERDFSDRLTALSATYGLLRNGGDAASLADVIGNELRPYATGSNQIQVDGPGVVMPAQLAVSVGLIVHELTTNACKYGGLCVAGGSLEVGWQVERGGARPTLRLQWIERNVPSIGEPTRSGFGSKLIDRLVRQHRGQVDRDWTADGLRLQLSLPLP